MPVWLVLHGPDTFQDEASRQSLAKDLTFEVYKILPPFYTNVVFIPTPSLYVGGERKANMVRFVIHELAGRNVEPEHRAKWCRRIDRVLKPHIADKGYEWEYHIEEPARDLWKIQGFAPPPLNSTAQEKWFRENRPSAYAREDGGQEKALL